MRKGPQFYKADAETQRIVASTGIPIGYADVIKLTPDKLEQFFVSYTFEEDKKGVTVSAKTQIEWFKELTKVHHTVGGEKRYDLRRKEKVVFSSWPNERAGMTVACYLAALAAKSKLRATVRSFLELPQILELNNNDNSPDLVVLHSFDTQSAPERLGRLRDYLDAMTDTFFILINVEKDPMTLDSVVRREIDRYFSLNVRRAVK